MNQLEDKVIFGKYKILKLISEGSFGKVYLAQNIVTKNLYAVKTENKFCKSPLLEKETYILYNLKGLGIPSVISYGYFGKYNVLVQTLLGKSLNRIWLENNKKLNLKDICMIAIQTLDRIEFVHSKYYIHRDIKPANFLVGYPDSSLIYLIDYGNARKYRSSRTGKHLKNNKTKRIFGTTLFLSINVLKGNEQSRKDDLESLGYMYIYLSTGDLPWSNLKCKNAKELLDLTGKLKQSTSLEDLCKGMPQEMLLYMKYVRELQFYQKPNYIFLRKLFSLILFKLGLKNDNLFSWVKNKVIVQTSTDKIRSRSNPQLRLMKKMYESHSKKLIENKDSYDNKKNINSINNEKENQNQLKIISKNNFLLSDCSQEEISDKKMDITENKSEIIKKLNNSNEGNNYINIYNYKEKINDSNSNKPSKNEKTEYESNMNDIKLNNNTQYYQKNNIKNKVITNPIIILNINKSNPTNIYKKINNKVNDQLNTNKSDKSYNKYFNIYAPYNNLDYLKINNDSKSDILYNISQQKTKISLKNNFPKNNGIKRYIKINQNTAKTYRSPINQNIYNSRTKDNPSANNKIYQNYIKCIQPRNFTFIDKNESSLESCSISNKKTDIIKKYNYNIVKKNQNKNLYDIENIRNETMNFDTETKNNKKGLYINLSKRQNLFVSDRDINPNYRSVNLYGNNYGI